jgi:hypothetical protein
MIQDEWNDNALEREDEKLLRLDPGARCETLYTFAVEPKAGGLRRSDVHHMSVGGEYFVELGKRKCWWMYVDEMDKGLTEEERRKILVKRKTVVWKPDCRIDFTAIA